MALPASTAIYPLAQEDEEAVTKAMQATGITHLADQKRGYPSAGQRQRAWIAMVLAQLKRQLCCSTNPRPGWISVIRSIYGTVKRTEPRERLYPGGGAARSNQACRYASHLIALREGKIVAQGAPKEIVTAELIERIYGLRR